MATKVLKELAVATSTYEDRNSGQTKNRYANVGAIMETTNDRGEVSTFILLDRHFNPAGVPFKQGSDQVLISAFDPKPRDNGQGGDQRQQSSGNAQSQGGYGNYDPRGGNQSLDDDIGF